MITGLAVAIASATTAHAADPSTAAQNSTVSEVVVTGTRIRTPNQVATSPVQTITALQVQLSGRPATIDILNQLPQVTQLGDVDLGPPRTP